MIEQLIHLDEHLFAFLNGMHSPFWDAVMRMISGKLTWIPLYLLVLYFVARRSGWKETLLLIVCVVLLITLADQTCSGWLKPTVMRYRPCQTEAGLDFMVHTVNGKCGGKFGFASSHAANFFAFSTFFSLLFRRKRVSTGLFLIAFMVGYSRIYLGVHYPGDVLGGMAIGVLYGVLVWWLYSYLRNHRLLNDKVVGNTYSF